MVVTLKHCLEKSKSFHTTQTTFFYQHLSSEEILVVDNSSGIDKYHVVVVNAPLQYLVYRIGNKMMQKNQQIL